MRLVPFAALTAAACVLTACSSSTSTSPSSSAPPTPPATVAPTSAASSTPVVSSTAPTPTPSPSVSSRTATTSAAPSRSVPASSSPAAPVQKPFTTTCKSLRVDVVKGGAIRGMEIAAMQFTNTGTSSCTITGTPTATLLRKGSPVGPTSKPNGDKVTAFTLQPGDYGESLLRDNSTCDAPLSDQLRLRTPSRNGDPGKIVTQPIQLRACTLRVAPVGEPS